MSFSSELKEEISKSENLANKEAVKYELLGYLMSNNVSEEDKNIKFSTENEYNINRFSRLLSNMNINKYDISVQGNLFVITVKRGYLSNIVEDENLNLEQIKWLIKGVYLGSGSVNNPEKKYHLEIGIKEKSNAQKIKEYLMEYDIKSNMIEKNNQYAIYLKDSEEIVNCETANLNKTINASIEQIEAIKKLKLSKRFEQLDDSLKEIAELRLNNPNASLIELGKMLKQPVGKSGVNYRLKKILEIANEK